MYTQLYNFFIIILVAKAQREFDINSFIVGIVGGRQMDITNVPWYAVVSHKVVVNTKLLRKINCGGSIISPNLILTAAHCIEDMNIDEARVRVGSNYKNRGGQIFFPKAYGIHPRYISERKISEPIETYDIGIILLQKKISFRSNVNYISLPDYNFTIRQNMNGQVCGHGIIGYDKSYMKKLHCVSLKIMSCQGYYVLKNFGTNITVICAGNPKQNVCKGDSGSGLVYGNNKLIGVVEGGEFCGEYGKPSIFTKINVLKSWVKDDGNIKSYNDITKRIFEKHLNVKFSSYSF